MKHLKGASLGKALALLANIRQGWRGLFGDKHSGDHLRVENLKDNSLG
jgi:hypothetical protein